MIKIEKGIPLKEKVEELPLKMMKVGDSFLIPKEMVITTVRIKAIQFAKRQTPEQKFSIKKVQNGHRCWRIK